MHKPAQPPLSHDARGMYKVLHIVSKPFLNESKSARAKAAAIAFYLSVRYVVITKQFSSNEIIVRGTFMNMVIKTAESLKAWRCPTLGDSVCAWKRGVWLSGSGRTISNTDFMLLKGFHGLFSFYFLKIMYS